MRTTLNIEDDLLSHARERAAREGRSIGAVISDALRAELRRGETDTEPARRDPVITFRGQGYGHGVGMCQCGAIGLARQGWPYDSILTHYYTGVDVRKLY